MTESESLNFRDARRCLSRIGFAVVAFFAATYATEALFAFVCARLCPSFAGTAAYTWLLSMVPMYLFGFPAFWLILRRQPAAAPLRRSISCGLWWIYFLIAYAVMYLSNLIGSAVNLLTDLFSGASSTAAATELILDSPMWLTLIFAVIVGPLVEETMFRRLLIDRLLPFGETAAIAVSALAFALFHGNVTQFVYAFAIGCVLGYLYCKTGRLIYTYALHVLVNFLGSIVPMLFLRGDAMKILLDPNAAVTAADLAAILPQVFFLLAYAGVILTLVAAGIVLLCCRYRRIRLAPAARPLPAEGRAGLLLSPGAIAALLVFAASFVLSYL